MDSMNAEDRIVVALDHATAAEALALVDDLGDRISFYKVGLRLFLAAGAGILEELKRRGKKVFLDLKFHDIPSQVANACREAVRLGADMLTVHALGGPEMLRAAVLATNESALAMGRKPPELMAVTVLTSLDEDSLPDIGLVGVRENTIRLASLAAAAGVGGVIASPREIEAIRSAVTGIAIATPGIRRPGEEPGEQKRALAPSEAIALGADFIVVGRPITEASDPKEAAEAIVRDVKRVLS